MSRKTDLNLSIGVDVKKGFEEAVVDIKNNGNKLAKASKQIAQSIGKDYASSYKKFNASFKETNLIIKDQEKNLKILTNELRQLEKQAKKYVVVPPKLRSELNHVTRALTDQRKGLKRLTGQALAYQEGMKASQMKVGIQQVGNAVEGVARSFQVAQGAAALLGDENEDVMKAMHKMQAVMVFAEGLRGLKHLKTSFELLNKVVKANPIIVAAAAIAALGVAAIKISQHFDKAYQAQKRQQEITEKATSSIDKEVTTLDNLVAIAKDDTIARETRLKAIQSLNETYLDTLENLRLETIGNEKTAAAILKTKDALLDRAKAQVVQEELVETIREQRKLEKEIAGGQKSNFGIYPRLFKFIGRGFVSAEDAIEGANKQVEKLKTELKALTASGGMPDIDLSGDDKGKTKKLTPFQINTKKLENNLIDAKNKVKRKLLDGIILEKDAKNQLAKLEVDFAIKKVAIAKKYAEEANKAEADSLDKQIGYKKTLAEQENKDKEKAFQTTLQEIDTQEQKIENRINERLAKGVDNQAQHDKKIFDAKTTHLAGLIGLYESQGMETADLEAELLKTQIDYAKQLTAEKAAQLKQQAKDQKEANKETEKAAKGKLKQEENLNKQLNRMLTQAQVNLYSSMAQNMGEALVANENVGEAMGKTVMAGMADFLVNMGQLMITAGAAKQIFDTQMVTFLGAGGAIAAGFGLVLAGSTMKAAMKQDIAPTRLAEGGVMKGTTFGMLAEYNTANNDPEVAIRSSYLRGMIADAVGNNGNGGNVKFRIEGRDLVGVLGRGLKDNSRA